MRFRVPLVVCLVAALAWVGCEERVNGTAEPTPLGPVFAKAGPTCDTKAVPVRDYFKLKATQQEVNTLLRDLATGCADWDRTLVLNSGFAILEWVEQTRESSADAGSPSDGALVVAVVWNVMQPFVCLSGANCDAPSIGGTDVDDIPLSSVASALDLQGAFGVRPRPDLDDSEPVISYGNSDPHVLVPVPYWGIEPYSGTWSAVLPGGRALILGYPDPVPSSGLAEMSLGTAVAYDWSVLPWYSEPGGVDPLSVTVCAGANPGYKEKVAHGGTILADGRDTWCEGFSPADDDPLFASSGFGASVARFARSVVPLWPQDLNASALGVSGSGKAREFSPYFGHQLYPEGLVKFLTTPGDASQYYPASGSPTGTNLICEKDQPIPDSATECPAGHGIRVHLTTSNESPLSGDDVVLLAITAEDNNGSWTLYGTHVGKKVEMPGYGLVYEWNNLSLDKPGAYKLHTYRTDEFGCVYDDQGNKIEMEEPCENTIGLAFPAATSERFIVSP